MFHCWSVLVFDCSCGLDCDCSIQNGILNFKVMMIELSHRLSINRVIWICGFDLVALWAKSVRIQKSCWVIYTIQFSTPIPKRTILLLATQKCHQQKINFEMQPFISANSIKTNKYQMQDITSTSTPPHSTLSHPTQSTLNCHAAVMSWFGVVHISKHVNHH